MTSLAAIVASWDLLSSAVLAYLDPGAGSFVLQAIIGAVFSVGFVMRNYWRGLLSAFRRPAAVDADSATPPDVDADPRPPVRHADAASQSPPRAAA
ncbi:MAG TPA: hypothetical protein VML55_09845 [Planctomycetaceae bacterium]|nr:hypothetical protein [Planctomycetaceae bacterium]